MEYGIITKSQEAFEECCENHGLDAEEVYVLYNINDLNNMIKDCYGERITIYKSFDAKETNIHDTDLNKIRKHNSEF